MKPFEEAEDVNTLEENMTRGSVRQEENHDWNTDCDGQYSTW